MRSERRHELEENDLADTAVTLVERLQPHLRTIGLVAVAALVALGGWTLVSEQRAAGRAESWDACMAALSAGDPRRLDDVIRRYAGTPAAQWSQLLVADNALAEGSQLLYADRARAQERLRAAAGVYGAVLAEAPAGLVAERATFGLAKVRENLGELDEARRGYEALVAEYPSSAAREMADGRIAALSRESTRQWYDWFGSQKPVTPPVPDAAAKPAAEPAAAPAAEPGAATPAAEPGAGTDAPR